MDEPKTTLTDRLEALADACGLLWRKATSKVLGKLRLAKCPECGSFNCVDASPNREHRTFFRCRNMRTVRSGSTIDAATNRTIATYKDVPCGHHFITRRPRHPVPPIDRMVQPRR